MNKRFVSWRRVSTFKQGRSGLGLEAQKEIIRYFVERDGGELIADYSECYTGKELSGCKELRKAMKHAKETGATLVIAKSDRFRNCQEALSILDEMGEGNIEFCDLPHSDRFTLTLFWALAEREALITSIRTKQALAVKKAQGARLGSASETYRINYKNKSEEQKKKEQMKKGRTKNDRFTSSRDVVAFTRIVKRVFPDACDGDEPMMWKWNRVTTRGDNCKRIIELMKDYRSVDDSNVLFDRWHFSEWNPRQYQKKLCTVILHLKRAFESKKQYQNI